MSTIFFPYASTAMTEALGVAGLNVEGELVGGHLMRLTSWAGVLPLAPGDVIEVIWGEYTATAVAMPCPAQTWIVDVAVVQPQALLKPDISDPSSWNLDALDEDEWTRAEWAADEMERELRALTEHVDRSSAYSVRVSFEGSRAWLDDWIATTKAPVWMYEVVREPGQQVTLGHELFDLGATDRPTFLRDGTQVA